MIAVEPFDHERFRKLLSSPPRNKEIVAANPRVSYLASYLDEVEAHTMVLEEGYIDRNFLEDYAAYYVRCYSDYNRKCQRIHFFTSSFDKAAFVGACLSGQEDVTPTLGDYLGFIVVKPLPQAFIGRTCLVTYGAEKPTGRRVYNALSDHHVHIFGREFSLKSMPFQEQDSVVAACATTALWSALQTVGPMFGRYSPTPAEITADSVGHPMKLGRDLPSSGLSLYQMVQVISRQGYEPEARQLQAGNNAYMNVHGLDSAAYLAELAHGYGSAGLPIILAHALECSKCKWTGLHASTISGFSVADRQQPPWTTNVDEFYAHDDQAGPFARLTIGAGGKELTGGFPHDHDGLRVVPIAAVIPAYPKIRITYEEARSESHRLAAWLAALGMNLPMDTVLVTATQAFEQIRGNSDLPGAVKERILDDAPPRFIWSTTWYVGDQPALLLWLDATNVRPSFFCYKIIILLEEWGRSLASQTDDIPRTAQWIPSTYPNLWVGRIQDAAGMWQELRPSDEDS